MKQLVLQLKQRSVHTPKIAVARALLALGMLLTLLYTDIDLLANHNYTDHLRFASMHDVTHNVPFKSFDLFMHVSPVVAKVVVMLILLVVMSGYLPQITCLLHVWVCFSVRNYLVYVNGGDEVALVLSILLVPVCITDPRINQWGAAKTGGRRGNIIASITYLFIQIQAAIIYLITGASKLYSKEWQDGTAVYDYSADSGRGAPDWLAGIYRHITLTPFVAILTWGIICSELLLFACIFAKPRTKRVFLVLGILLHFMITVTLGLVSFFLSMAALLILYLDDDNYCVKYLERLKQVVKKALKRGNTSNLKQA